MLAVIHHDIITTARMQAETGKASSQLPDCMKALALGSSDKAGELVSLQLGQFHGWLWPASGAAAMRTSTSGRLQAAPATGAVGGAGAALRSSTTRLPVGGVRTSLTLNNSTCCSRF
ncbi:hypothetical protein HaLaN_31991 [Haematococcus lacustris]|uniref:Uncharacterized protein n=1 Tax=Haematococcus lacustris TaxID=44745 RepID=A0A6A0AJR3_HAELA|nr:hypothetical protein HaLaN_31991 [Haematococcus lacustris]